MDSIFLMCRQQPPYLPFNTEFEFDHMKVPLLFSAHLTEPQSQCTGMPYMWNSPGIPSTKTVSPSRDKNYVPPSRAIGHRQYWPNLGFIIKYKMKHFIKYLCSRSLSSMYRDRPKSPSFTLSVEDTRTFLAAISLREQKRFRTRAGENSSQLLKQLNK